MLPDFATMARVKLPEVDAGALADGINFHHESDRVFHRLERFREHESWTLEHLLGKGLRRGPARGVAHVGVELCLDGALVADSKLQRQYDSAIETASSLTLSWADQDEAGRFSLLIRRLAEFGAPIGYSDPQIVSDRLVRILEPRPLLRLHDEEAPILREALPEVHERVCQSADELMDDLRRQL